MTRRLLLAVLATTTMVGTPVLAAGHGHAFGHDKGRDAAWPAPDDGWAGHGTDPTNPQACDPIDPAQCMLPYPNDWFTKPDPNSATGRRLDLNVLAMPRNAAGKPVETQEFNRSDGFSAGAQILTVVPGMTSNKDLVPSGLPPVTDLAMNDDDPSNLGVFLIDTKTGEHVPVWVEIDQYTQESGAEPAGAVGSIQQDLMIHPAINLNDGTRYIVALRNLHKDDGSIAQPSTAFSTYLHNYFTPPAMSVADPRQDHMNHLFDAVSNAGVDPSGLYLAWDFTTASTLNVTGRLLAIRDDAFKQLGDTNLADGTIQGSAPAFTVDSTTTSTDPNEPIERQVTGHFTVPCYIAPTCEPPTKCDQVSQGIFNDCPTPGQFALDPTNPDAVPSQVPGQTYQANFICNIPRTALDNHQTMRPVEYGHGLFGGAGEVNSGPQKTMASKFGMMYCATDWTGMATADVPNAVAALTDMSRFPWLTDRVQQGELNFLYLARLMAHPQGFSANPAFQFADGTSVINLTDGVYYDGNSQGGIYGGTVCAVSPDVRHCVLGVPGMDYSILLPRSSDYVATGSLHSFDPSTCDPTDPTSCVGYSELLDNSYPDQSQRLLLLDLAQTLWDRSDPNGYASHMTSNRLPNTPSHEVLMQAAYGDHQVANITAETEARTIGAHGLTSPVVAARYGDYQPTSPFWGLPALEDGYDGSAIMLFDSGPASLTRQVLGEDGGGTHAGTDPPPAADTPNRSGEDPHEAPRRAHCGQEQKDAFMHVGGLITLPCGSTPYFSWSWDGTSGL